MTILERLYDYAYKRGITVESHYYPSAKKGFCAKFDDSALIFLNDDKIRDSRDKTCVLAEEIGHTEYDALLSCEDYLNPEYKKWLKTKNEILAKRWAYREIIPPEKIQAAIDKHCLTLYEIAEECYVDVEYLTNAMEYYRNQGIVFSAK